VCVTLSVAVCVCDVTVCVCVSGVAVCVCRLGGWWELDSLVDGRMRNGVG